MNSCHNHCTASQMVYKEVITFVFSFQFLDDIYAIGVGKINQSINQSITQSPFCIFPSWLMFDLQVCRLPWPFPLRFWRLPAEQCPGSALWWVTLGLWPRPPALQPSSQCNNTHTPSPAATAAAIFSLSVASAAWSGTRCRFTRRSHQNKDVKLAALLGCKSAAETTAAGRNLRPTTFHTFHLPPPASLVFWALIWLLSVSDEKKIPFPKVLRLPLSAPPPLPHLHTTTEAKYFLLWSNLFNNDSYNQSFQKSAGIFDHVRRFPRECSEICGIFPQFYAMKLRELAKIAGTWKSCGKFQLSRRKFGNTHTQNVRAVS